jgi:formylglycine-generating enzyme
MFKKSKYDIVFSVAAEDLPVAVEIYDALSAMQVKCYLYTKNPLLTFGENIFERTVEIYGKKARHVLIITSRHFIEGGWTGIEQKIIEAARFKKRNYVLQLCLDGTKIDWLKNVGFIEFNNNPAEVAEIIRSKIKPALKDYKVLLIQGLLLLSAISLLLFISIIRQGGSSGYASSPSANDSEKILPVMPVKRSDEESNKKTRQVIQSYPQATTDTILPRVRINAATFTMGSNNGLKSNQPAHTVQLHTFSISTTEITVAQYNVYCIIKGKQLPPQPPHRGLNENPVVNISWQDASDFCKRAGGRLPTEAEWEYAAGAGILQKYSGGNNASIVAVYGGLKSSKVATKDSNSFGLYDMTGNVAEWCSDWYGDYPPGLQANPQGPASGSKKVVRGGAYNSSVKPDPESNQLRITYRTSEDSAARKPYIGFRVVWDK